MKKFFAFITIVFVSYHYLVAQTSGIMGKILSDNEEPLPHVGIFVKSANSGTSSNLWDSELGFHFAELGQPVLILISNITSP
jgi:hypothetical protein